MNFFFCMTESREKQQDNITIQFRLFHLHSTMSVKDLPTSKPSAPVVTSSANTSCLLWGNHKSGGEWGADPNTPVVVATQHAIETTPSASAGGIVVVVVLHLRERLANE
jgi:hypothetical protein